jgi:hypothetical protein
MPDTLTDFTHWRPKRPLPWLFPLGALICIAGSMAGVGGGLFAVPALYMLWGLPMRNAIATGLVLMCANTGVATAAEMLREESQIVWPVVGVIVGASMVGTELGYRLSKKFDVRAIKKLFTVVLALGGLKVMYDVLFPPSGAGAGTVELDFAHVVVALVAGFGGGVLAPLLGVGGGLIVVPALLLGMPELGYGPVRACSMAAATVTSFRSAWLHMKDRRIHWPIGGWLAASALLGASLGVFLFHIEGMEKVARTMLAFMLWYVTWRFVTELRKPVEPEPVVAFASETLTGPARVVATEVKTDVATVIVEKAAERAD